MGRRTAAINCARKAAKRWKRPYLFSHLAALCLLDKREALANGFFVIGGVLQLRENGRRQLTEKEKLKLAKFPVRKSLLREFGILDLWPGEWTKFKFPDARNRD